MDTVMKEKLIRLAMDEARKAIQAGDRPFGAVLSDSDGNMIAIAHNTENSDIDPTAHAEINLIRKVTKHLESKNLSDFTLVSNAQSCPMCFSAAIKAKISNFIFGYAWDEALTPKINVFEMSKRCNREINITTDILSEECKQQIETACK